MSDKSDLDPIREIVNQLKKTTLQELKITSWKTNDYINNFAAKKINTMTISIAYPDFFDSTERIHFSVHASPILNRP